MSKKPCRANAGTYYPTYDGNGNISEYLGSRGTVAAHYAYDVFGNLTAKMGTNAAPLSRSTSTQPLDPETGLYYYGYRYCDPVAGRWPNRDPIEEQGGLNLYGFVDNDGVNTVDLLGLCTKNTIFEISKAGSVQTPKGVFFTWGVSGKIEKDDPDTCMSCCYYANLAGDFEIGVGLKVRKSFKLSVWKFTVDGGVTGELSLAKQKFSGEVSVKYCPDTGELEGTGKYYIVDFDPGLNAELSGCISGKVGRKFNVSGNLKGTARMSGKVQGWFDVQPASKGAIIKLMARASFDINATVNGGYKILWNGFLIDQGKIKPRHWSVFGDSPPDTGDEELARWTLP